MDEVPELGPCMNYIWKEYAAEKVDEGKMSRKEFFTFLWELKQAAKQGLNEGQMMSCWMAVSRKKDYITFEELKDGIEICYENQFFARENGAPPPVFALEESPNSYDTMKLKSSKGVKAFEALLKDEENEKKVGSVRQMTLYGQRPHNTPVTRPSSDLPPVVRERPPVAPRPTALEATVPLNNFGAKMQTLQQDREQKRLEAQKKMDEILAARYQEQKKQREAERQKLEQERAAKRQQEAVALTSEPAWKLALRNKSTPTSQYGRGF